jgi:hypothetical protein
MEMLAAILPRPRSELQLRSLDDLRDEVETVSHRRRDFLKRDPLVVFRYHVGAQPLSSVKRMRHGRDAGRVYGVHAIHQREDVGQLACVALDLGVVDAQPGQMGDFQNFFPGQAQSFERPLEIRLNYLK